MLQLLLQYNFSNTGYANEVGEAFRSLVPLRVVYLSYAVSSSYVLAHAAAKGWKARTPSRPQLVRKTGQP